MICVIKVSGKVVDDPALLALFAGEVRDLLRDGIWPVIVHGGGRQLTELSERLGIVPTFVEGRRVTCGATLEAAKMVFLGVVQPKVVAALGVTGCEAVGLSGADGRLLLAVRRPPKHLRPKLVDGDAAGDEAAAFGATQSIVVDYGHVGDIFSVRTGILTAMREAGLVPVVSSLAAAPDGALLNVNADTVAAEIAVALRSSRLIMISDTPGVRDGAGSGASDAVLAHLDSTQAEALIAAGKAKDGMVPKLTAAMRAIRGGVGSVRVVGPEAVGKLRDLVTGRSDLGTVLEPSDPLTVAAPVAAVSEVGIT